MQKTQVQISIQALVIFLVATVCSANTGKTYDETKVLLRREEILEDFKRDLTKKFNRSKRAVRLGESRRLTPVVVSLIKTTEKRLKASRASLRIENLSANETSPSSELSQMELNEALNSLNPYQRELAEEILVEKKLLKPTVTAVTRPVNNGTTISKVIDLESKGLQIEDKTLRKAIEQFVQRSGSKYYAVDVPPFEIESSDIKPGGTLWIYEEKPGYLVTIRERLIPRSAESEENVMKAGPQTVGRQVIFIKKSPFLELKDVEHWVVDRLDVNVP